MVLTPGETCWRTEPADRVAFLVDIEAYFTALLESLQKARRSILILGWGFDPRARLAPDGRDGPHDPDEIGRILIDLSRERPELDIRLLIWRSAFPIAASQEFFPHRARRWFQGTPVDFRLDDQVPLGACHHQKAVIIDDRVAFCGGADISVDRWDSPAHLDGDVRRIMPDQRLHAARHEVMALVDGAAARALGDHFRARWRNGAGEDLPPPPDAGGDPWPDNVPPQVIGADVALARTAPAWRGRQPIEEIERLTLAAIAEARETIYLENQYFTSPLVTEALAARLSERDGPQIVLVTTGASPSWFDRLTMDHARGAMVWRLRSADVFGRFQALHPLTAGGAPIIVHSKTSIFDDRMVRISSANLNNRSLGFDTELEVAVACEHDEGRRAIAAFRDRLAGHFIGHTGDAVARARAECGGLIGAIQALDHPGRLRRLDPLRRTPLEEFVAAYHLGDPYQVEDSWRLGLRRRRLLERVRALRAQVSSKSITSGR